MVGPGAYNDHDCFTKMRKKPTPGKFAQSHFGKDTGQPYYVYVGNSIMIDPTFFDQKTKGTLIKKGWKENNKIFSKDIVE